MKNSLDHSAITGRRLLAGAAGFALVIASQAPAFAQLPEKKTESPGAKTERQNQSANRCARYGEGFVPVEGSDACVRIGGRLRIDFGGTPHSSLSLHNGFAHSGGIHADDDGLNRAYIRVPARRADGDPILR